MVGMVSMFDAVAHPVIELVIDKRRGAEQQRYLLERNGEPAGIYYGSLLWFLISLFKNNFHSLVSLDLVIIFCCYNTILKQRIETASFSFTHTE